VRQDETALTSRPLRPAGPRRPARTPAHAWAGPFALAALVAATSLAVALYASVWLVAPYLALMALVLGSPGRGRREPTLPPPHPIVRARAAGTGEAAETPGRKADLGPGPGPTPPPVEAGASPDAPPEPAEAETPNPEPAVVKTRRGKGRGRKPKPAAPSVFEPTGATWVRVGPGQFVRADPATAPAVGDAGGAVADETTFAPVPVPVPGSDTFRESPGVAADPGEDPPESRNPGHGVREGVAEWIRPRTIDPDPAVGLAGEGKAEGEGPGLGAELDLGPGVPAGDAPDDPGVQSWEDNGIAPDASDETTPGVRGAEDGCPLEFEGSPPEDRGPDPDAVPLAWRPEPQVMGPDDLGDRPAPVPAPEGVGEGTGPWREPLASSPKPKARPVFRVLAGASRGLPCRRGVKGAGATRPARASGGRRGVRSARVSGSRRHPSQVRRPGRSPHADRTHPPRSPPCGSGRDPPRIEANAAGSLPAGDPPGGRFPTNGSGAAPRVRSPGRRAPARVDRFLKLGDMARGRWVPRCSYPNPCAGAAAEPHGFGYEPRGTRLGPPQLNKPIDLGAAAGWVPARPGFFVSSWGGVDW